MGIRSVLNIVEYQCIGLYTTRYTFLLGDMMYTSVKLRIEAKRRLEELQARLKLRGVKATLYEILEKLIELGIEEEEVLLGKFRREVSEEDPMLRLLDEPLDWGVEDSSTRINEVLYGGGHDSIHRHRSIRSSKE